MVSDPPVAPPDPLPWIDTPPPTLPATRVPPLTPPLILVSPFTAPPIPTPPPLRVPLPPTLEDDTDPVLMDPRELWKPLCDPLEAPVFEF